MVGAVHFIGIMVGKLLCLCGPSNLLPFPCESFPGDRNSQGDGYGIPEKGLNNQYKSNLPIFEKDFQYLYIQSYYSETHPQYQRKSK